MKKYSLIIGLILSLTLTGCKGSGIPKKEKYSNEVEYAEFNEGMDKLLGDDSEIVPSGHDEEEPSIKVNGKITSDTKQDLKDGTGAQRGKMSSHIELTQNSQFDGANNISKVQTKGSSKTEYTLDGEGDKEEAKADFTRVYQVMGEGETAKNISVNQKDKEYYLAGDDPSAQIASFLVLPLFFYGLGTAGWDTKSADEKAKWHFYIDKEVLFTATYTTSSKKELSGMVGSEYAKYADKEDSEDILIQFKVIKKKDALQALTVYFEMSGTETTTYVADYQESSDEIAFHNGDVFKEDTAVIIACRLELAKVTLSPVDVSSYTLKDVDEEAKLNPLAL